MPTLFNQVKNIMASIKGAGTTNYIGDLDKKIDSLNASDALDVNKKSSFVSLIRDTLYTDKNSTNRTVINDLSKDLAGATVSKQRVAMYDEMMKIFRFIPILNKAANIYISEILAPDPTTKMSINVTADVDVNEDSSKYTAIIDEYKDILKKANIEDEIQKVIFNTIVMGDQFVEISTVEGDFRAAISSNHITLKEAPVVIQDSARNKIKMYFAETDSAYEDSDDGINHIMEHSYKLIADEPNDDTMSHHYANKSAMSARKIKLFYHDPRNIVIVRQNHWVLGYLYIDKVEEYKDNVYRDEKPIGDILIDKLTKAIQVYLKDKVSADIPDDLKDTITNVLNNNYNKKDIFVRFIPIENMQHFKMPSIEFDPYGESYFINLLPILRMYISRLIASTIYRIARAGKHMLIDVDVTNTRDAAKRMEEVKRAMKMREVTGADFTSIDKVLSHISTFEDIYVSSKDGKRLVNIDTFEMGGNNDRTDEDSVLLKNILTGLEIPPSYLGVEEFATNRNTLSQESIVFARSILRLQTIFTKQLTSLLRKIYTIMHRVNHSIDPNVEDVVVTFPPPQDVVLTSKEEQYNHAKNIVDLLTQIGYPLDKAKKKFFPDIQWDKFTIESFNNQNQQQGGDMGMGGGDMGMGMGGVGDMGGSFDDMGFGGSGGLDTSNMGGGEMGGTDQGMGGGTPADGNMPDLSSIGVQ